MSINLVFECLSHPVRRKILALVRVQSMNAGELSEHFDISKPSLSMHFKKLMDADLLTRERDGNVLNYSANLSVLEDALARFLNLNEEEK